MARLTDTVMVSDSGRERTDKVTIDTPSLEGLDIEGLAQRAWNAISKKVIEGEVMVSVKAFGR